MTNQRISHYEVTNRRTGVVKIYQTSIAAMRAVDAMDRAHGASIGSRKAIWVSE